MDQNVYESKWANLPTEADLAAEAMPTSHKKSTKRRKMIIAGVAAAAILVPSAAWAAVELFGFGSINAAASTTSNLTVNGTPTLDHKLVPGQTVGVSGSIHNPNDFAVTVNQVILRNASLHATPPSGSTEAQCKISLAGGTSGSTSFPPHGGASAEPGTVFTLASPVNVPANGDANVTVPNVVKQDASASILCGFTADYAVRAQVGS